MLVKVDGRNIETGINIVKDLWDDNISTFPFSYTFLDDHFVGGTETQITVLISFLIASPATYWLLSRWLDNFAYRIRINPMIFLAGGILALTIALATISYHTFRSARANPVKALRYE